MREYKSGYWGFSLVWGLQASVFPRAICLALPNAIIAFILGTILEHQELVEKEEEDSTKNTMALLGVGFTSVLFFVLYFRSNVAYGRWWEGGTLLQQTRGEWFNAYSSLVAFSATDPKKADDVEAFHHCLARLMSMLFSAALQQVSPDGDRLFPILDPQGIDPDSLEFLRTAPDKVEVILQWIQRTTIINMTNGILPTPPPVMSRAFQEISRGIVNLQNARKIADFPFPFPYAQASMAMLLIHWAYTPIVAAILVNRWLAFLGSFVVVFFLWCINYIALDLEFPFGEADNDLPMMQMQADWNKSIGTLLAKRASQPPKFEFDPDFHRQLGLRGSDGSVLDARRLTEFTAMGANAAARAKKLEGIQKSNLQELPREGVGPPPEPESPKNTDTAGEKSTTSKKEEIRPSEATTRPPSARPSEAPTPHPSGPATTARNPAQAGSGGGREGGTGSAGSQAEAPATANAASGKDPLAQDSQAQSYSGPAGSATAAVSPPGGDAATPDPSVINGSVSN